MRNSQFVMVLAPLFLSAASPQDSCQSPFKALHAGVRHTESKGVGYSDGYTTLEVFGIYDHDPDFMPFFDLRGHVFNDGKLVGNLGIGQRTALSSINHLFGFYCYYDVRQARHDFTVNQLSPGIELMGKRMEYRVNTYFPLGKASSSIYGVAFDRFRGNQVILKRKKKYAMRGADGEVGVHITQSTNHDVYAALGPYYFTSKPHTTWGGKGRFLWKYHQYLALEASYFYDHLFKNTVQGMMSLSYPFGGKITHRHQNCNQFSPLTLSRAAFAPYRFEIPVVTRRRWRKVAQNPSTRRPWRVWFVNNTSSSSGTFESPFPTLAQAQAASSPNDLIYLFSGNGTSTGMSDGIVLQDGQVLFGSGMKQRLRTTQGRIFIPPFSSAPPKVTNRSGSVITLANHNEVSGIDIQVVAGNGINAPQGINGTFIHNNLISGDIVYRGVSILGYGNLRITNNRLFSSVTDIGSFGINLLVAEDQYSKVQIQNNTCIGYRTGISFGPNAFNPLTFSTAFGDISIAENVVSDFGFLGIVVNTGMSSSTFTLNNNTIYDTTSFALNSGGIGIFPNNPGDAGRYYILNNRVITTTKSFVQNTNIAFIVGGNFPINIRAVFKNNTLTVRQGGGIGLNIATSGQPETILCTSIVDNLMQTPTDSVSMLISGSPGMINVDRFSNNQPSKVTINQFGGGSVNFIEPSTCGQ